jgi:NlpC/P60 family
MRCACKFGLALSVLWMATIGSAAAARGSREAAAAPSSSDTSVNRMLSAEQGEALVDLAVESAADLRSQPDCSHLVHLVYMRAGLNYAYQHSRALYAGVPDFQRVKNPQPGDLIVWPGHVGMVVSPENKTFFSSVRSGIITESWTADYWLARGRRRFFRYRLGPDTDLALLASLTSGESRVPSERRNEERTDTEIEASNQTGPQGESEDDADVVVAGRRATSNGTVASTHAATDGRKSSPGSSAQASRTAISTSDQPEANALRSGEDSTSSVAIIRQRSKPGKQAIAAAFIEGNRACARKLTTGKIPAAGLDLERPISVVAGVPVIRIKISHSTGTVMLKLNEVLSLQQGRVLPAKTRQRELSIHRRSVGGSTLWIISDPQRRIYLPESQALRVFESQAELLLHRAPETRAARTVVKALDILYDQQPDGPQRAALK